MKHAVRATLVFGFVCGVSILLLGGGSPTAHAGGWATTLQRVFWVMLTVYALMLVRWYRKRPLEIFFPLALLLVCSGFPLSRGEFFLLGASVLGWVRSGICSRAAGLRAIIAECTIGIAAAGIAAGLDPYSPLSLALGAWLFFLIQSLYFFMAPGSGGPPPDRHRPDPFEKAFRDAERIIDEIG